LFFNQKENNVKYSIFWNVEIIFNYAFCALNNFLLVMFSSLGLSEGVIIFNYVSHISKINRTALIERTLNVSNLIGDTFFATLLLG